MIPSVTGTAARPIFIGTAGWTIPRESKDRLPSEGSHLERYAARFNAVEINSSFYKPHRPATYARWAATVPPDFRFSLKLPKEITHKKRLVDAESDLLRFLAAATSLGNNLGPILIQLPPSFAFEAVVAETFFRVFRHHFGGLAAVEPRHQTWFDLEPEALIRAHQIARVAADPPPVPGAEQPGGWSGLSYYRLHGSPRVYYSPYSNEDLQATASALEKASGQVWCIMDNTALGYATTDALTLRHLLRID